MIEGGNFLTHANTQTFLIAAENLPSYLAAQGLIGDAERPTVRELGGGVSNLVLLVEFPGEAQAPERRWVVKQSLEKLRVQDDWRSERGRIFREAAAIRALRPVVGDAVPEVLHVDHDNFLCIMTAAPRGSAVWKESLLAGDVDLRVARAVGELLARIIKASRADLRFCEEFNNRTVFDQLRVDPYYRTTASRRPEVARALHELIEDSWAIRTALVHGDYSPKNILARNGSIFLIDFEVVHWGDPAFDSGFLLNHLCLKSFHRPHLAQLYLDAAREFWKELLAALEIQGASDFERMTARHLGGLMLARIDGKSPVEYITDPATKERVRGAATRLLLERPEKIEECLDLVGRATDPSFSVG